MANYSRTPTARTQLYIKYQLWTCKRCGRQGNLLDLRPGHLMSRVSHDVLLCQLTERVCDRPGTSKNLQAFGGLLRVHEPVDFRDRVFAPAFHGMLSHVPCRLRILCIEVPASAVALHAAVWVSAYKEMRSTAVVVVVNARCRLEECVDARLPLFAQVVWGQLR